MRRIVCSRLRPTFPLLNPFCQFSSELQKEPKKAVLKPVDANQTYASHVQKSISGAIPIPKQLWLVRLKKKLGIKTELEKSLDIELKTLLDKAATLLYYDCADNYPYLRLLNGFDAFVELFSMCLFKLQSSLDAAAYHELRDAMLNSLWFDVDKRLELLSDEYDYKLNTKADMKKMHGVYLQALFEYDEGFLSDDCVLAGAVWRNLFMSRSVEPLHLNNAVKYIRSTIAFLDEIEVNDLIVGGVKRWEPAEQLLLQ